MLERNVHVNVLYLHERRFCPVQSSVNLEMNHALTSLGAKLVSKQLLAKETLAWRDSKRHIII